MPNLKSPSIYPHLVAEFIESADGGNTLQAIEFITKERLKGLKDEHAKNQEQETILRVARESEKRIFVALPEFIENRGIFNIGFTQEAKKALFPILSDIFFLIKYRVGVDEADTFRRIVETKGDAPGYLIIEYIKGRKGEGVIKRIQFKDE